MEASVEVTIDTVLKNIKTRELIGICMTGRSDGKWECGGHLLDSSNKPIKGSYRKILSAELHNYVVTNERITDHPFSESWVDNPFALAEKLIELCPELEKHRDEVGVYIKAHGHNCKREAYDKVLRALVPPVESPKHAIEICQLSIETHNKLMNFDECMKSHKGWLSKWKK